jgi:hypothetical protein
MSEARRVCVVSFFFILAAGALFALRFVVNQKSKIQPAHEAAISVVQYSQKTFSAGLTLSESLDAAFPSQEIIGGIIPHDLNHSEYIAHFFRELSKTNPSTILLVGPNHYERGASHVITSRMDWQSPEGIVHVPDPYVTSILSGYPATENAEVLQGEHSIGGIMPYIAYFMPDVEVVPVILKVETTEQELLQLEETLTSILPEDSIVVSAVDFSHYLTAREAEIRDQVTRRALETFDIETIQSFGSAFNDYLDSPPSIAFLLSWSKRKNAREIQILYNTNSGILGNDMYSPVTSYFEAVIAR